MRTRTLMFAVGCVALGLHGCGSDPEPVPTAEALAQRLLSGDELGGDWTPVMPPDGASQPGWGVVTAEMQEMLPRLELCEAAGVEARAATDAVEWAAFMQLELDTGDPIEPPDDRSGHLVMLQQYLVGVAPDDATAILS